MTKILAIAWKDLRSTFRNVPALVMMLLAPLVRGRKGEFTKELEKLAAHGFTRARIDGELRSIEEEIKLDKRRNHTIEVVVDRLLVKPGIERRLAASVETALPVRRASACRRATASSSRKGLNKHTAPAAAAALTKASRKSSLRSSEKRTREVLGEGDWR